jgi:hypothetical protein
MLVQHEFQVGHRLADLLHHPGQEIRPDGRDQRDLELAAERIGVVAGERDDLVALVEHAPRAHHDLPAHVGELHVLRLALDQFHAEVVLQLLELRGQGRLAHERALGSPAEMPRVRERHQIFEVLEIHEFEPILAIEGFYQIHSDNQFH